MDMKKRCNLVLACVVMTFLCLAGCFPQKKVAVAEKPVTVPPAPEIKPSPPAEPEPPSSRPKPHLVKLLQEEYPDFRDDLFFSGLGKALKPIVHPLRADVPIWLDHLLAKAVARDARQRFETAEELLLALERGASRPLGSPASTPLLQRDPLAVWQLAFGLSALLNVVLLLALLVLPRG